jgi:alkyl hydroperoxide reductase subunit AhpC
VAASYGCFNETFGYAERSTFFLDSEGVITEIVASDRLDVPRDFDEYSKALGL